MRRRPTLRARRRAIHEAMLTESAVLMREAYREHCWNPSKGDLVENADPFFWRVLLLTKLIAEDDHESEG